MASESLSNLGRGLTKAHGKGPHVAKACLINVITACRKGAGCGTEYRVSESENLLMNCGLPI